MANLITEELYNLLIEKQELVQDDVGVAHDYPSLKAQTIQQELHDEIEALLKLLGEGLENFRLGFLNRCKQRAEQNTDTCLSLFAMPEGECNQLYWQIAERLCEPKTLGHLLGILLPNNTTLVTYEVGGQGSLRERTKNPVFHFEERSLTSLNQPPSRAALDELAVGSNQLFEVANLVQFDFSTHEKFFHAFQKQRPQLAEAVYQHNEDLKTLQKHLLLVNQALTPREIIKDFIQQLLRGGETLTGEIYASPEAQMAVTDFLGYIESLPSPLKETLLELKNQDNRSLNDVCTHLRDEHCVEQASEYLQGILNNKDNAAALDARPHLSPEQEQAIRQHYKRTRALATTGSHSITTLPAHYLEENLKQLVIEDAQSYLNLLLAFPPGYYTLLFKHAQITCAPALPEELGEMIENGLFNSEQLAALNQAVIDNMERLDGFFECLRFALTYSNYELLELILSSLSPAERLTLFRVKPHQDKTLLHSIAETPEALRIVLPLLPESDRLVLINEKDKKGNSILHLAAQNPDALKVILASLPETERLAAVTLKNSEFNSALHLAANNPEALEAILTSLPESLRLAAITGENSEGENVLHLAVGNPKALEVILISLPESARLTAVNKKNDDDDSSLHCAIDKPEALKTLLTVLPEEQRWEAVKKRNRNKANLLHRIIYKKDILEMVFSLLHESHRLTAIQEKNRAGESLLQRTIYRPETILTLLTLLPKAHRFTVITKKSDDKGNILLHRIEAQTLVSILELLPETERLSALTKQNKRGKSVLHYLPTYNPAIVKSIFALVPENRRLAALRDKSSEDGESLLLRIADEPEILLAILTLLPQTERFTALIAEDRKDNKILYQFADDSETLQAILALLSPADYQTAVFEIDYYKQISLFNFLQEKRQLFRDVEAAHDYPSLKAATAQQELRDEIEALTQLLGKGLDVFREGFLDRCKQRAQQNAGTCLSLFAMPDGECNQLYWQIAERLFEPKAMGDMLGILAPNVTTLINYEVDSEVSQGSLREQAKNPVFYFEGRSLTSLTQKPSRAALSELAVSGNQLFEVTNLVQFDFATHEKFFNAFQQQYPELAGAVYQHNEAFKTLQKNIAIVGKGQTPREVINEFIQRLLLGGKTLTGEDFASLDAQKAVTDFFVYLESLPNAIKEALLLLRTPSSLSLNDVCKHLRNENCVEQAASYLKDILNNEANEVILATKPLLPPEQAHTIHQLYGRTHPLPAASTNTTTTLPAHYLEEGLKQLFINDEQTYLNLILAFPPSYYTLLLKHVQTSCDPALPRELGEMMKNGLFNREQLTALNQAIVDNMERFGGFLESLRFSLNHNNDELLRLVLTSLSPEERLAQFKEKYDEGGYRYTLLHIMAGKPESLTTALTLLPEPDRLATINEQDSEGNSVLHLAANNPDALKAILTSLPKSVRLKAINKKNSTGNSVLHVAINNPQALQTILDVLSPADQAVVKEEELYKRATLFNFLQKKQQQLNDAEIVHDYPSLKAQTIQQELHAQIESLLELLNHSKDLEAFRQVFLACCEHRAEENVGTCLSLFAMPDGECNQLYWQIAELLFKPKTLGDMLGILVPNVATVVSYEVVSDASQGSLREQAKNPVFHFEERSLTNLTQKPSRAALSELAVSGNQLFEVANLAQFDFAVHEKFFNAFQQQYPELAGALYQHNDAFKTLQKNIAIVSKGQTPREVINEFIQRLLLGGETLTGETFASIDAQKAATDFFGYLESLPNTLKEALLELKTKEAALFSLNNVCEHLRRENCVELAASYLKDILNNDANAAVLDTRPHLSPEQLQAIQRLYGRTRSLPIASSNTTTTLPAYYLQENLKQLVINDEQAYLNLLLAFPPNYYTQLLKHAQIACQPALPDELGDMIENGLFNSEQLAALNQAIVDNMERLGSFFECLQFALNYSNYELAKLILTSLPPELRVARLTEKDEVGNTLLHAIVNLPEILTIALTLVPESGRLAIINGKNNKGKSVLHLAAKNPNALKAILMSLPESDRLAAVNEKNGNGDSALHLAAYNSEALEAILTSLPAIQRWDAVKETSGKNTYLLHQISSRTDRLKMVFGLLHESHRLIANKTNNLLMGAIYSPKTLATILALIPETERLTALKDDRGNIILPDIYARYIYNLTDILPLLPNNDLLEFFTAKAGDRQNILERITAREQFVTILDLLPEAVPSTSSAYSTEKNTQISMLYSNINQLRSYGRKLYDQVNDNDAQAEGKKAIRLALNLNHFANKFIYAENSEERKMAQIAFGKELRKGVLDMQHRALWKPVLANIVLAATGLGLLAIIGKVYFTGNTFFMQTERHKQIDKIASNFTALQTEEETPLVSASA